MTRSKRGPGPADDVTSPPTPVGATDAPVPWIGRSAGRQPWPASSSPSSSGLFSYHDGRLLSVLRLGVVEGRVQGIHVHADPDRLAGLGGVRFAN